MRAFVVVAILLGCCGLTFAGPPEPGLLFHLSGDHQFTADYAASGAAEPNYVRNVEVLPNGPKGSYFQCADTQLLSYWAPGNIYAQRGTLSFFWRSRYPVGPTAFPIFRVGFADHSSWDMAWLRIDYNGHGFDAFVTDASLARTRVSVDLQPFPKPDEWTHLALSWDETHGIRFYINGKVAAVKETVAVYNVGLDQFGPHSRIISPWQVQSDYNFVRGGDIDEISIYDRMVTDENVATLAKGDAITNLPSQPARTLSDARWRDEWSLRYGWNRPDDVPPYYEGSAISVRKVEIHDAYDLKRWWWKATDGIRETTWPGVYNRSRLPGRNDYFQLPDWDCYVQSGKSITFIMPEEPWNHLEIAGAAWGKMDLLQPGAANDGPVEKTLFERPKGQEKTVHRLAETITGRKIRFTNVEQEEPIGELVAYNVTQGKEPAGSAKLAYRLTTTAAPPPALDSLVAFVKCRFPADEQSMMVAQPLGEPVTSSAAPPSSPTGQSLPLVHILIPDNWEKIDGGLDGIAIDLPALNVKPTHGAFFPINIQVKDPLWTYRDMLDFTFSIKPGEAKTLWLDLRDRILPEGKSFYLTIAGAGADFNAAMLEGAQVRLVFKPRDAAKPEHELDRFTQAKDCYAMLVEEHPNNSRLNMWNRFEADLTDLLRVNPNHYPGRNYAAASGLGQRPPFIQPTPPEGVPLWAFRQVDLLGRIKHFVNWYIDNRQVEYGDFGGGISDDVDLLNTWPGVALMGSNPEKISKSLHGLLEAAFNNGMFTNGLPTIQADELHSYEEGIDCLSANMILDYGNPRQIERAMATALGVESITGINAAGHRHIKTSYYNGKKMAEDEPWGYSKPYSFLVCQAPQLLVDFNGNPHMKQVMIELADGMLAHRHPDGTLPLTIRFKDDYEASSARGNFPWHIFWTAYKWTGDPKYLQPIRDGGTQTLMSVNANLLDILDLRKDMAGGRGTDAPAAPDAGSTADAGSGRAAPGAPGAAGTRGGRGGRIGAGGRSTLAGRGGRGSSVAWQLSGDKSILENLYASQIDQCDLMEYIDTEGSLWIDRVGVPYTDIQRQRLGGVALIRNSLFPGHTVSWKFVAPANDQSVAILVPFATAKEFKVIAYNLETTSVHATMTGWNVDPGTWDITQGIDTKNADVADQAIESRSGKFERASSLELTFPPRATTILTLKLKTPGTPYWQRPDLGISRDDIAVQGNTIRVTVHSLGSVDAPATTLALVDPSGKTIASAAVPALKAPLDLIPKTTDVTLTIPSGAQTAGCSVVIDPEGKTEEITRINNRMGL